MTHIKSFLRRFLYWVFQIDWVWKFLDMTVTPVANHMQVHREQTANTSTAIQADTDYTCISPDLTVKHGVFQGMKYPRPESVGSTLLPKLLGSYEQELEPLLKEICAKQFSEIVDIGCAEGYYAIGLALRIKSARIFAFDNNPKAIELCQQMAKLNNVSDRVTTGSFCDINVLKALPLTTKALIVCDCEGYEKELFTQHSVDFLAPHELLIETHDFMDIEISDHLHEIFKKTHKITRYRSIDDITKAREYSYTELEGFDLATKKAKKGKKKKKKK